jgi:uncharacterized protein (TIGR02265 family)
MPVDRGELEQRLAQMTPQHTVRGMFFRAAHQAIGRQASKEDTERLASYVPRKVVDMFMYPAADYLRLLHEGADSIEPHFASSAAALAHLGSQVVVAFFDSPIGRTVKLAAAGRPRAVLVTLPMNYSVSCSWGRRAVRFTGEKSAVVDFFEEFIPAPVHAGVVEVGLGIFGGKNVRAVPRQASLLEAAFDVAWE